MNSFFYPKNQEFNSKEFLTDNSNQNYDYDDDEFEEQQQQSDLNQPAAPVAKPTNKAIFLEGVATVINAVLPKPLSCRIICKGGKCKYESSNWPPDQMAIDGLYSHWLEFYI